MDLRKEQQAAAEAAAEIPPEALAE
jgi:hypothetical protein